MNDFMLQKYDIHHVMQFFLISLFTIYKGFPNIVWTN